MKKSDHSTRDPHRNKERPLFYQPQLSGSTGFLEGDEAHHALKVLRLKIGDDISVTNGTGTIAQATITAIEKNLCNFKITETSFHTKDSSIHIFVAPTKNADRMEWLVEKATEIGVSSIHLVKCDRSERVNINDERLRKVALSAMKQSQQSWLTQIHGLLPFKEVVQNSSDQKFIGFVDHSNPDQLKNIVKPGKLQKYAILIGPEGDFTKEEVDLAIKNGWKKVSLGPNRLRTETAALVGGLTLMLANQ